MTPPEALMMRAKALKLHGLLAHWEDIAASDWVAPLLAWEEHERARRGLERRLGNAHACWSSTRSAICPTPTAMMPSHIPDDWSPKEALAVYAFIDDLLEHIWPATACASRNSAPENTLPGTTAPTPTSSPPTVPCRSDPTQIGVFGA
jgi:hypothetical protein